MSKNEKPQFSMDIVNFLDMITSAKDDYDWNLDEVIRLDKLTQDYLHMLELENLDYRQRAKVATKISKCLQLRRASKDTVEVLKPFIEFIDSGKGRQMINLTKEVLGKTRKVEQRMVDRAYRYRIFSNDTV